MDELSLMQGDTNRSHLRKEQISQLSDKGKELYERDKSVFLKQSFSTPVLDAIEYSEGAYLYDYYGKKYLDCHGNGVHAAGFNNPYIIEKMISAMKNKNTFTSRRFTNENIIKLAEKLVEISPEGLDRVTFCPGGSEAIEIAISIAKCFTKKWKTISFWDSYHGNGFQSASVGGERVFKIGLGPMVPGSFHVEFPNYNRNPWNYADRKQVDDEIIRQMRNLFEKEGDIACVIGEPISATPLIPTKYFWQQVKMLCEEFGALLIFDEVIEGFGRTGKMFASEYYITPDVLVMGKSLGGGLVPFAGILTHKKYDIFENQSLGHYTHEKNGLCGTAGLAMIEFLETNRLIDNSEQLGQYILKGLNEIKKTSNIIGWICGIGLHIGIEILSKQSILQKGIKEAEQIMYECLNNGVSFKTIEQNIVTLRPSLVINKTDADLLIATIKNAVDIIEYGKLLNSNA